MEHFKMLSTSEKPFQRGLCFYMLHRLMGKERGQYLPAPAEPESNRILP